MNAVFPAFSSADMSDADYQAALSLAEKKVARTQGHSAARASLNSQHVNALSSSLIRALFGRTYQVGDHWDVASWSAGNTMARMTNDPEKLQLQTGRTALFRYEVVSVKPAPEPEVVLQVTQLENYGLKKVDARVKRLKLRFNDKMLTSRKTYEMIDSQGVARTLAVSPDAMHSAITPLELFPLDVPELTTAESSRPNALPTLPDALQSIADQTGYRLDLPKSSSFKQDDFFGREIQALWQQGEPWPSYLKTSNGVSILISKGAS
jgi:hypothetical protein